MKLKITVHSVAYEVDVEVLDAGEGFPAASPLPPVQNGGAPPYRHQPTPPPSAVPPDLRGPAPIATAAAGTVVAPIAGTVIELSCKVGDSIPAGGTVLILEAMKMKTNITSAGAGKVKAISVAAGDSVREGETLVELE